MNCEVVRNLLRERIVLGAEEDSEIIEHLGGCAACREEREALVSLVAEIPAAMLAPVVPSAPVRARLLEHTRHGRALPTFAGAIARLFDLPREQARALLRELEQPSAWRPGVVAGNWMRPVRPGPAAGASAVAMMLRTTPGTILPHHGHHGAERTFVLQGGYRDSAGGEVWAGDYSDHPAGVEHELHVLPPVECVAAVLVQGGVYRV
jgi:putative transcriptional regulator